MHDLTPFCLYLYSFHSKYLPKVTLVNSSILHLLWYCHIVHFASVKVLKTRSTPSIGSQFLGLQVSSFSLCVHIVFPLSKSMIKMIPFLFPFLSKKNVQAIFHLPPPLTTTTPDLIWLSVKILFPNKAAFGRYRRQGFHNHLERTQFNCNTGLLCAA